MKKLITFLLSVFVVLSVSSQDIVNKTGVNGKFLIQNSNGETMFNLTKDLASDPELIIAHNWQSTGGADLYMLQIQSSTLPPIVSFASMTGDGGGAILRFHKSNGINGAVVAGDNLGAINFIGYKTNFVTKSAQILSNVVDVSGGEVAANLLFKTHDGAGTTTTGMSIHPDGQIAMSSLVSASTSSGHAVGVDAEGKLFLSTTAVSGGTAPNIVDKNNLDRIDELEDKNQELQKRLEKLEAIVEELSKQ